MPDDVAASAKRKVGPLPVWGWVAVIGGTGLAYYLYQRHAANVGAAAATGTTAGTGTDTSASAPTTTTTTPTPVTTLAAYEAAALARMAKIPAAPGHKGTYISQVEALNGLRAWLNGSCVDQRQSNALGVVIRDLGLPPTPNIPALHICATTPTPTTTHTPTEAPAPKPKAPAPKVPTAAQLKLILQRRRHQPIRLPFRGPTQPPVVLGTL